MCNFLRKRNIPQGIKRLIAQSCTTAKKSSLLNLAFKKLHDPFKQAI